MLNFSAFSFVRFLNATAVWNMFQKYSIKFTTSLTLIRSSHFSPSLNSERVHRRCTLHTVACCEAFIQMNICHSLIKFSNFTHFVTTYNVLWRREWWRMNIKLNILYNWVEPEVVKLFCSIHLFRRLFLFSLSLSYFSVYQTLENASCSIVRLVSCQLAAIFAMCKC